MNPYIKFMTNNIGAKASAITFSSELASNPFINILDQIRSKTWRPSGCFEITDSNNKLYVDALTITLTNAKYTTGALLASHIQTKLNAASSGWTVSYSSNRFTISRTSSSTLKLSTTTNSIWETIGFLTSVDLVGTSFPANVDRKHTSEWIHIDLGCIYNIDFFALIGKIGEQLTLSNSASVKIYGNNINDFSTAHYTKTITRTEFGYFAFIEESYRYWKIEIIDKDCPDTLELSHFYLGDMETFTANNVSRGFTKTIVDQTRENASENGTSFYRSRPQLASFVFDIDMVDNNDRLKIENMFRKLSIANYFYVSFDPQLLITNTIDELTKFVKFSPRMSFKHSHFNRSSITLEIEEVQ